MIVCHCRAVSDRQVTAAIDHGAAHVEGITAACGAGSDCGGCHPRLEHLLHTAGVERPVLLRVAS